MRISQLKSLNDDELSLLVYVINVAEPITSPEFKISKPSDLLFIKHDALLWKLVNQEKNIADNSKSIFNSLMVKLNKTVEQDIKDYEYSIKPELTQSEFQFTHGRVCLAIPVKLKIESNCISSK